MNICLVNNIFPPIITGSSIYTFDLASKLSELGHNVIVITAKSDGNNEEFEDHENGFKLYRLDRLKLFRSSLWMNFPDFYFTLFPSNFKRLKSIILENNIEIIHQCNNIFDLVFASAYISKKMNIPLVCMFMTQIQHSNKILNKILEVFDKTIVKLLFVRFIDLFIIGDKESERYLNERYGNNINYSFIHPGISKLKEFSKIERDYSKTNNLLVSLGHVSYIKDRKEIVSALPKVKKIIPEAKVKIIGSLFCNHIKKEIKENNVVEDVIFTGKIERENILSVIKDADIGSMFFSNVPYMKTIGAANIELMASGLPVILDAYEDNFGPDMPFKDGVHFVKLKNRDPEWLATKMIELFQNPDMRERIGRAGQKFVLKELSWGKAVKSYEAIYRSVIDDYNN